MKKLVSVIIPVYNVEAYIEKCVESLLDQTYTNFEALIVDDGSPDSSILLAKQKVGNDPRFRFFEKENGGQGTARNLALDNAKGDYIAFLDSDDYYEADYLLTMIDKVIESNADICICNIKFVNIQGQRMSLYKNNLMLYLSNKDYLMSHNYISNFMWDKLFKVSCFDGLRFDPSIRTYEDVHLLFRIVFDKKITSVNNVLYNYVQRTGSTMHSLPKTYINDRYEIYREVKSFYFSNLKSRGINEDPVSYHYLNNFILNVSMNIVKYSSDYKKDINILLANDDIKIFTLYNILKCKSLSLKKKFSLVLLRANPLIYSLFIKLWFATQKKEKL